MNQLTRALLASVALTLAVPSFAQDTTPAVATALVDELRLDEATAQRVEAILTSAQQQATTLRTQLSAAMEDLRRARSANDAAGMKTALDRFRGLHNRLNDLGTETIDRVFANLTLVQQADFALWVADSNHMARMLGEDRA